MIKQLIGLLMFVAGVAITFTIQLKAGVRPTLDVRKWLRPIWSHPAYNRKPLFWFGLAMWITGIVVMLDVL